MENLKQNIKNIALELGFSNCRVTNELSYFDEADSFLQWLELNYNYKMSFLERNLEKRFDLRNILPEAKNVIAFAIPYNYKYNFNKEIRISRCALIKDYHLVILKKLQEIDSFIKEKISNYKSKIYVDTGPVLEKQIARKAGIGWQGRNSLILTKEYGSWIFLGIIINNLELSPDAKCSDFCGNCRKCIESCPTNAITENRNIDTSKCIAYWTIESKEDSFPLNIKKNLQNWIYGCDICQQVCPWNKKAKISLCNDFDLNKVLSNLTKEIILNMDDEQFNELFKDTPIARLGLKKLKRNCNMI